MRSLPLLLLLAAVALPVSAQDSIKTTPTKSFKRQPNVIAFQEIDPIRHEVPTAYELIQRLRPQFLRGRGATSLGGSPNPTVQVLIDGAPRGGVSGLRQVQAVAIEEIRYLSAADASIRFGTGYGGGAILVTTRTH